MDKKYDISLPRPRRPIGPPPPPFPPIVPKQNIINVNVSDNNGQMNYAVLSSLQVINSRLTLVENALANADFAQLELGEVSGTAYPGDKGAANAALINYVIGQIGNLKDGITSAELISYLSNYVTNDNLIGYATTDEMTNSLISLRSDIEHEINNIVSGNIDMKNVSGIVSGIVSSIVSAYIEKDEEDDYTDILNNISDLNDELNN